MLLPENIKSLDVSVGHAGRGQLLHSSRFEYRYLDIRADQSCVGLLMPLKAPIYQDTALFPVKDQNIPEGDLFLRLRQMFLKQAPGLAVNEYLYLKAASKAGIATPGFDLTHDGQMLLIDRFDIDAQGKRFGFEDIASLMGLRVRDTLAKRKFHSSYQRIAEILCMLSVSDEDLARFYAQAFSVMVSNGDGHLKNYGVLYDDSNLVRLSPMFDVVTTTIYRHARYLGDDDFVDQTLALKLFAGKGHKRSYHTRDELLTFGRSVCAVQNPENVLFGLPMPLPRHLNKPEAMTGYQRSYSPKCQKLGKMDWITPED